MAGRGRLGKPERMRMRAADTPLLYPNTAPQPASLSAASTAQKQQQAGASHPLAAACL